MRAFQTAGLTLLAFVFWLNVRGAALDPLAGKPDDFFGITNLHTLHLVIAPPEWAKMEDFSGSTAGPPQLRQQQQPQPQQPPQPPGQPGQPGNGFGPRGPGEGMRPGGGRGGPPMGFDFKEGVATLEFEGKSWGCIQVRFKGNSSFNIARNSLKRSLKLDFNDVEKGKKFFGLTKLNLNNNAMDPVQMREALGYEIFRRAGVPASRTAFAKVYVTVPGKHERAYMGLYTAVEQVDERFLRDRFGTADGILVKPEGAQGLPYLGDQWSAYERRLETKTSVKKADTARFIAFLRLFNSDDVEAFQKQAASFMDVEAYLRFVALQSVLANMDSPLMTGHNYYVYLNSNTGKLSWIPWDLNEVFGGFRMAGTAEEQMDLSILHPFASGGQLFNRVIAFPGMKEKYEAMYRETLATNFNLARLTGLMETTAAAIRPALVDDRTISIQAFDRSLTSTSMAQNVGQPREGFGPDGPRPPQRQPQQQPQQQFQPPQPGFVPPGGPGAGGGAGGPMRSGRAPIKLFITKRMESIENQLAGKSEGYSPRAMNMNMMRGGPRGGGGEGGGGFGGPGPGPGQGPGGRRVDGGGGEQRPRPPGRE